MDITYCPIFKSSFSSSFSSLASSHTFKVGQKQPSSHATGQVHLLKAGAVLALSQRQHTVRGHRLRVKGRRDVVIARQPAFVAVAVVVVGDELLVGVPVAFSSSCSKARNCAKTSWKHSTSDCRRSQSAKICRIRVALLYGAKYKFQVKMEKAGGRRRAMEGESLAAAW